MSEISLTVYAFNVVMKHATSYVKATVRNDLLVYEYRTSSLFSHRSTALFTDREAESQLTCSWRRPATSCDGVW